MAVKPPNESKKHGDKLKCFLPLPCVKGTPTDYSRMSVDQLRRFIPFMYECKYRKKLPNGSSSNDVPTWWPNTVSFDKFLGLKASASQKGVAGQQKELSRVVRSCYEFAEMMPLLALGAELSDSDCDYQIRKSRSEANIWTVSDKDNCVLVEIHELSRTYDTTRRELSVFIDKEMTDNADSYLKGKRSFNKNERRKTGQSVRKKGIKRKLIVKKVKSQCQYCSRSFNLSDFKDEHEQQCIKGPFPQTQSLQTNFMQALGMLGSSQRQDAPSPAPTTASNSSSDSNAVPDSKRSTSRAKNLRKVPKRNQLMAIFRNNPIPITSIRGQKLVAEYGDKVNHSIPPEYEKDCKPQYGFPLMEKEFPCVTKRAILKHSDNAHVFTYGRRQRQIRYQELVIGLSRYCWRTLNACKRARLKLHKLEPTIAKQGHLKLPRKKTVSYLEKKFHPAISFPRVCLVDFRKHSLPGDPLKYLQSKKSAATSSKIAYSAKSVIKKNTKSA